MAKLYAELTSDKGGRVASKGGDKEITTKLNCGNLRDYTIVYKPHSLLILDRDDNILLELTEYYRA